MQRLLLLLLFFFVTADTTSLYSQPPSIEWQKCLGGSLGDFATAIAPTTDGGYITLGFTESNDGDVSGNRGDRDLWVVKITATGTIHWQKSLGGMSWDEGFAVHQTTDGGYIVAGSTASPDGGVTPKGGMDFWLLKLSANGDAQWQKNFGGARDDKCYSMQITPDGGYILAGFTQSDWNDGRINDATEDFWVVKVTANGDPEWQKRLGGSSNEIAKNVQLAKDGGFIVAGYTQSPNGDVTGHHGLRDMWVVKLSASGVLQWQKALGGRSNDEAAAVEATPDGSFVVAGYAFSNDGDVSGNHHVVGPYADLWVVKLSASGDLLWQKCLGGNSNEEAYALTLTPDGGILVAGSAQSDNGDAPCNAGKEDYWVVKLNESGVLQWQKSIGGSDYDNAYSVRATPDGGCILAGITCSADVSGYHPNTSWTFFDYWIIKLSASATTKPEPKITISTPWTAVCSGTPVQFTAVVENAGADPSYQWEVNGAVVGTNSPNYTNPSLKDGDCVRCILSARNTPCELGSIHSSNSITLLVKPLPVVSVRPADTTVMAGTKVQLAALVSGTLSSFTWTPTDNLIDPQSLTPLTAPLQATSTYQFLAVAQNGCATTSEAVIKVVTKLYMPNSFTPDDNDLNDVFRIPPGTSLQLKEFTVFDRWGNKVFNTKDASKGWNGTFKGKALPTGVYVFIISGSENSKKVFLKGTVQLIR